MMTTDQLIAAKKDEGKNLAQEFLPNDLIQNLKEKFEMIERTGNDNSADIANSGLELLATYIKLQPVWINQFERFIAETKNIISDALRFNPDPGVIIFDLCTRADELGVDYIAGTNEDVKSGATTVAAYAFIITRLHKERMLTK